MPLFICGSPVWEAISTTGIVCWDTWMQSIKLFCFFNGRRQIVAEKKVRDWNRLAMNFFLFHPDWTVLAEETRGPLQTVRSIAGL